MYIDAVERKVFLTPEQSPKFPDLAKISMASSAGVEACCGTYIYNTPYLYAFSQRTIFNNPLL